MAEDGYPIQFIEFVPKRGFSLTKEAEEFLNELHDQQLGVVTIAGKYRTGKSFFVNRILLDKKEGGFGVGSTIKACTKGLWMWRKTIKSENPDHPDLRLLIIDTEGFGGIEEGENHDSRIFLLAILLSSFFIYNSMGNIDENALQSISLVINMAKDVKLREEGGDLTDEDIAMTFPDFLWLVRDFSLKLVDKDGKKLSSQEYLENCLQPLKGVSENVENKNKIRRMLKHFFQSRDCMTVVRPAENEEEIQKLNELESNTFRKEFIDSLTKIKSKILRKCRPKKFNNATLNGPMMIELAKAYIEVLNSGRAPNIKGAWHYLVESENVKAIDKTTVAIERYLSEAVDENFFKSKDWRTKILDRALKDFEKNSIGESEEKSKYLQDLENEVKKRVENFYARKIGAQKESIKKWIGNKGAELMSSLKERECTNFKECENQLLLLEGEFRNQYDYLPEEILDGYINEFKAEKQKELFSWIQMELNNEKKREKQALEMRIVQNSEEYERALKLGTVSLLETQAKVEKFEIENLDLQLQVSVVSQKNQEYKEMMEKSEATFKNLQRDLKDKEKAFRLESLQSQEKNNRNLESLRQEFFLEKSGLEKRVLLLEQELKFKNKEIDDLRAQVDYEKEDKRRYAGEIDSLKEKLNSKREILGDELIIKQEDYMSMEKVINQQLESLRSLESRNSEERLGRQLAESKVSMMEESNKEVRQKYELIISNLKNHVQTEDSSRSEINSLKRKADFDLEEKIRSLEAALEKLKIYKFVFKYAMTIQCSICTRHYTAAAFVDHVLSELPADQNPFKQEDLSILRGLEERPDNHKMQTITVSISQTMVKEDPEKNGSSYTEYVIQVRTESCQWVVCQKYRAFCELHNQLSTNYPGLKFPPIAKEIFGGKDNLNKLLSSRKTPIIEDRRQNLQMYLKELLKIEEVIKSRSLRAFLEIDKYYDGNNTLIVGRQQSERQSSSSMLDSQLRSPNPRRSKESSEVHQDNMTTEEKQKFYLRKLNKDKPKK